MQRLFSTFASGWPGIGLFIQRFGIGIALLHDGIVVLNGAATASEPLEIAGAVLGLFILAGLWTPVAGTLIAVVEMWVALSVPGDMPIAILLAILGGTIAMIGPGAWSIDARLFGRKSYRGLT